MGTATVAGRSQAHPAATSAGRVAPEDTVERQGCFVVVQSCTFASRTRLKPIPNPSASLGVSAAERLVVLVENDPVLKRAAARRAERA